MARSVTKIEKTLLWIEDRERLFKQPEAEWRLMSPANAAQVRLLTGGSEPYCRIGYLLFEIFAKLAIAAEEIEALPLIYQVDNATLGLLQTRHQELSTWPTLRKATPFVSSNFLPFIWHIARIYWADEQKLLAKAAKVNPCYSSLFNLLRAYREVLCLQRWADEQHLPEPIFDVETLRALLDNLSPAVFDQLSEELVTYRNQELLQPWIQFADSSTPATRYPLLFPSRVALAAC